MYKLSSKSLDNLNGVHPKLVCVVHDVIAMQKMDFSVSEGLRSLERQKELFTQGRSKTMASKHLKQDDDFGHAVDLYPYPINMVAVHSGKAQEIIRFGVLAGLMFAAAQKNGVQLRWGGDWNGDGQTLDHTFFDAPHFEIVIK